MFRRLRAVLVKPGTKKKSKRHESQPGQTDDTSLDSQVPSQLPLDQISRPYENQGASQSTQIWPPRRFEPPTSQEMKTERQLSAGGRSDAETSSGYCTSRRPSLASDRDTNEEFEGEEHQTYVKQTAAAFDAPFLTPAFRIPRNPAPPLFRSPSRVEEVFPKSALKTPIRVLRTSRGLLCLMLNVKQKRSNADHLEPDYRGLATLLDFRDIEIGRLNERNPTEELLEMWAQDESKHPYLWNLVRHLQSLGREDIIEECHGRILKDVKDFVVEQKLLAEYTEDRLPKFDCYVNIADEDVPGIGREIVDTLEGVYGLRLFLTIRDLTIGQYLLEHSAQTLQTRCSGKIVIVMTKSYENSGACQFLTQFAAFLDKDTKTKNLIPLIVDEDVPVPCVLQGVAVLNYHRDQDRLWRCLVDAIQND